MPAGLPGSRHPPAVAVSVPTAAWSLPVLVQTLERRGWGDELGERAHSGARKVLHALVALLPHEAAEGQLTVAQVALRARLTPRWTSKCLRDLEALGVITWRRGWLDRGQPRAGWIRVVKSRIAGMVRACHGWLDAAHDQIRAATRARLARLAPTISTRRRHHPLSRRPELSSPLPAPNGRTLRGSPGQDTLPTLPEGGEMQCETCNLSDVQCQKANARVPRALRHPFKARRVRRALVVTPSRDAACRPAPAGWRSDCRPAHPMLDLGEGSEQ